MVMQKKIYLVLLATTLLVSCRDSHKDYDATGSFEGVEITVSAEAAGRVLHLDIVEGQKLKKNQMVGAIDSIQLYLQKMSLLSSRRGISAQDPNIDTQTAAIKEQIATLKREQRRVQNLIAANAATHKQLDDINSQIEVLNRQLSAQQSVLQKSSASISAQSSAIDIQIAQIDDRLNKTHIASPIDGVVLGKYVEAGELVNIGMPVFKIADLDNLFLRVYVTSNQLAVMRLNDTVRIGIDAGNGKMRQYNGVVSWISDKAEFTPKTIQTKDERANMVYAVKIAVKNDGYIKIGMYGEVKFN